MDELEKNKWTEDELENILIEFRYKIIDAKTFYLVSILLFIFIICHILQ